MFREYNAVSKSPDSETRLPGFESWLCYFLVMRLWTSYLTPLCLSFLMSKIGLTIIYFKVLLILVG